MKFSFLLLFSQETISLRSHIYRKTNPTTFPRPTFWLSQKPFEFDAERYRLARDKADFLLQKKTDLYNQAEWAMKRGDGAGAKRLSEQAKVYGSLMDEANAIAADEILSPQEGSSVIDLHGLFVKEAINFVMEILYANPGKEFKFITGKGIHSDPQRGPALQPAIEKLCVSQNWRYSYCDGCFTITSPAIEHPNDAKENNHDSIQQGTIIPSDIWTCLKDSNGLQYKLSRMQNSGKDLAVIYVDPRKSSSEIRQVFRQFEEISECGLNVLLSIISVEDEAKKNLGKFCASLSDPDKKMTEYLHCRSSTQLLSALLIVDPKTCAIKQIWYEGCWEWEIDETAALVTESVQRIRNECQARN